MQQKPAHSDNSSGIEYGTCNFTIHTKHNRMYARTPIAKVLSTDAVELYSIQRMYVCVQGTTYPEIRPVPGLYVIKIETITRAASRYA